MTGPWKRHRSLDDSRLLRAIGDPHVAAAAVNLVPVGDRGFDGLAAGKCQQSESYEEGGCPQHAARIVRVPRSHSPLGPRLGSSWGTRRRGPSPLRITAPETRVPPGATD